jgi:hypothetical protein
MAFFYLLRLENLVLWAMSGLNGCARKNLKRFWSTGVLEYCQMKEIDKRKGNYERGFHYSITPIPQYSSERDLDLRAGFEENR